MTYPRPVRPCPPLPDADGLQQLMFHYQDAAERHEAVAAACYRVAHTLDVLSVALHHLPGAPEADA